VNWPISALERRGSRVVKRPDDHVVSAGPEPHHWNYILTDLRRSVLPPPSSKNTTEAQYRAAFGQHTPVPYIESNNTIANPTGPEYQLLVGEGAPRHYGSVVRG